MIRKRDVVDLSTRARRMVATATAFTFLCQNFSWAVCADGSTFPTGGFVPPPSILGNWQIINADRAAGSIFVPDNSVFEHNDPAQPLTGGGHNWLFDQGSTLCKQTDSGPAGGAPTAWLNPAALPVDCTFLPIITGSSGNPPVPIIQAVADVPYQGDAVTPTCDPTQYVGSNPLVGPALPTNSYFNHLGCSISHGAATTPQTATTYMFVAGLKGGLFVMPLTNVANPVAGGEAGKTAGAVGWFGNIPLGQQLNIASVSPDGQFALATSLRRSSTVYGCYNPLGDPTRTNPITGVQSFPITGPVDPNFSVPHANTVPCMQVGNNGFTANVGGGLTTAFGPDSQPYFGGQLNVNSFNGNPGGSVATAWPQCIFNGFSFANPPPVTLMGKLAVVFNARSANHCGTAQPNGGFSLAGVTAPNAIIRHGSYMYAPMLNNTVVVQFKVTADSISGLSQYKFRTYIAGLPPEITGLGVADDLQSLMIYINVLNLGAVERENFTRLPLCEDM